MIEGFSTSIQKHFPRITNILASIGVFTVGIALLAYAYLGTFARYFADDYCLSGMLFQMGFWKAQVNLYTTWSPDFVRMFFISASELFGHSFIRVWPMLTIVAFTLSSIWMFQEINKALKLNLSGWIIVLLAELMVLFTLIGAPNQFQILYWRIGLVSYTVPMVFFPLLAGTILYYARKTSPERIPFVGMLVCALVAFVGGGFAETYVTLQTSMIGLALLFVLIGVKNQKRRMWIVLLSGALVGSLLSMLVIVIAPGNAIRIALMPARPGLFSLVYMSVTNAFLFIYTYLKVNSFLLIILISITMLVAYIHFAVNKNMLYLRPTSLAQTILLAPVVSLILVIAVCIPSAYAESSMPDGRVLVEAVFILVLLIMVEGFFIGASIGQLHQLSSEPVPLHLALFTVILMLGFFMYPLYDSYKTYRGIPEYRALSISWDKRDAAIRAARQRGDSNVQVKGLNIPGGLAEISTDPGNWVNQCAASFYDLDTIQVGGQ
jgi:hypothetical protein